MSPPRHFVSGTGQPPPQKSKFLQTCNRFSLFLKQNTNIRDLHFGGVLEPSPPPAEEARTIDLLSTIDHDSAPPPPQYDVILDSSCEVENNSSSCSKTAPMTIFYGGKVMVLDDVPADRARDLIMLMAQKADQPQPNEKAAAAELILSKSQAAQDQAKDSDLPIARRASLHKFLAKRKDRATVRAMPPYQLLPNNNAAASSSSGNHHTSSFDLNSKPS